MKKNVVDDEILKGNNYFILECLERFANIEIACYCDEIFYDVREHVNFNPVRKNAAYREQLLAHCEKNETPVIFIDNFHISYIVIKRFVNINTPAYFLIGPIALQAMDKVTLHRFYYEHGLKREAEKSIPILSVSRVILLTQITAGLILDKQFTDQELIQNNQMNWIFKNNTSSDRSYISMEQEEQEAYHHTYHDERRLLECVRHGKTEEALKLNLAIDDATGIMSANYFEQAKKIVVVAITLNTRAAIEGGVPPYEAYQLSDFYMQKMDQCSTEIELIACKNEAIRTLSDRVHKYLECYKASNYVQSCVNHIERHYREHLYLEDIAKKIGITPTYLSKLFSQEMGITFQQYVLKVRVDRAANLLIHSEVPLFEIGDYVNFPNQSYFGRVFKQYTGMTPKTYRMKYKPREFQENK